MHLHPDIPVKVLDHIRYFYQNEPDGTYKITMDMLESTLCHLVSIDIKDSRVYFGHRGNRRTISPLINLEDLKEEELHYTNKITAVFSISKGKLFFRTVYWGDGSAPCEPQPGRADYEECLEFWTHHALIPEEKITVCNPCRFYKKYLESETNK